MVERFQCLKAVVLDWAGTTIDHGSRAPAIVFQEILRQRGIPITITQARGPMGMAKRDHLAAIAALPDVSEAWQKIHGRPVSDADIEAMYVDFLPLQRDTLRHHCDVLDGVPEAVSRCREAGLKIGSSTGYTRDLMSIVTESAARQGYQPDCVLCAEDVPQGRPAPYLLYEAALRLKVYPLWAMVAVDDTPVGIAAGRNAGCWTVGVTRTGNCIGLSAEEAQALPPAEINKRCASASEVLTAAGAHFTIESLQQLFDVLQEIEAQSRRGILPIG